MTGVVFASAAGLVVGTWSGGVLPGLALMGVLPRAPVAVALPGVAFGGFTLCSEPVVGGPADWPLGVGAVADWAKALTLSNNAIAKPLAATGKRADMSISQERAGSSSA